MREKIIILTLLCFAALHLPSSLVNAKDIISPLRIKIGTQRNQDGRVNIIKGNFYVQKREVQKELKRLSPKSNARPSGVIPLTPCPFKIGANTKEARNLADSFKKYMTAQKRDPAIIEDLYRVSSETGTDFGLLVLKAKMESNFDPLSISKTSSAQGIFQYIDSTWLILLDKYGERIGHPEYSDSMDIDEKSGKIDIRLNSPYTKEELLNLRKNVRISTLIKAWQIKEETPILENYKNGERLHNTDQYIAHMLGLNLAEELYQMKNLQSPELLADSKNPHFNEAVALNPAFFYDSENIPLNAEESYQKFHLRVSQEIDRIREIESQYGGSENAKPCSPIVTAHKN